MSDRMFPMPVQKLMDWTIREYEKHGSVFGVKYKYTASEGRTYPLFEEKLENLVGPAAGPHTQLAQNIIAAYFAGARFFELKTVQTLDGEDLPVAKPCIKADDEGYNVEWSTELRVPEAMEEYIKAWYLIKIISKAWELGDPNGFVFNLSVGYDYEGISSPKIDSFIEGLKNARNTAVWEQCKAAALDWLPRLANVDEAYLDSISPQVCTSVTLSTLHGCPPAEIEKIATHLIEVKGLNTFIKCNPTLLGYDYARKTLDEMGYDYIQFDEHHFQNDLQFEDAVPMITRLRALAAEKHVTFGVKLTNTFPVQIAAGELPGEEMYMSGVSLYPLSISLALKLSEAFDGKLPMSFSGGADYFNIREIVEAGVYPVTIATTLLKPGGYGRLVQIAKRLEDVELPKSGTDIEKLKKLVSEMKQDPHHVKPVKPVPSYKTNEALPMVDCFHAPCEDRCPIHQDITAYMELAGKGRYEESLTLIMQKNPLPFMTGTICNHRCMSHCTRNFYEEPIQIRSVKLEAAEHGYDAVSQKLYAPAKGGKRVAIVGGGPAGIAAAHLLAREGVQVTVFEKREKLGGVVRYVIPEFRIPADAIDKDISFLEKLGVELKTGVEITSVQNLKDEGYDAVILAVGAYKQGMLDIPGAEPLNALAFLEDAKNGTAKLGKHTVVIGAGNTAMDVARAAKRIDGVEKVSIVYRRTKRYMPADEEELLLAMEDGVEFLELMNPVSCKDGMLTCQKMRLGAPDDSGRRSPVATEETIEVPADSIIVSVGEQVDEAFLSANDGEDIYAIGDCKDGAATVVEAIRDAQEAVDAILSKETRKDCMILGGTDSWKLKPVLEHASDEKHESERCLKCSSYCENCVEVCPNRANVEIMVNGKAQILHLDDLCNECGNCATFCPYGGRPYLDKLTLFSSAEKQADSENFGFYLNEFDYIVFPDEVHASLRAIAQQVKLEYDYMK